MLYVFLRTFYRKFLCKYRKCVHCLPFSVIQNFPIFNVDVTFSSLSWKVLWKINRLIFNVNKKIFILYLGLYLETPFRRFLALKTENLLKVLNMKERQKCSVYIWSPATIENIVKNTSIINVRQTISHPS